MSTLENLDLIYGAPLFVLRPGGKIKGKYSAPRNWQNFTAEDTVARLAAAVPGSGFGMVCGHAFDVIDVDPRNGGEESFKRLVDAGAIPGVHLVVATPSGGFHIYIDPLNAGKHPGFLPGIDLQAAKSFVFCPPTEGYRELAREEWPDLGKQPEDAAARLSAFALRKAPEEPKAPSPNTSTYNIPEDVIQERVAQDLRSLDALAALKDGERLDWPGVRGGVGWDACGLYIAARLVEAANSGTNYTLDQAREDFLEHSPAAQGTYDPEHKFQEALKFVGAKPLPYDNPADVFGSVLTDDTPQESAFIREIEREAYKIRVREAARAQVTRERLGSLSISSPVGLAKFLAEPDEDARYRVDGLWPTNGRVVLSAQYKAGKTTLVGNLIRSLVDGEHFLDRFAVEKAARVVLIDNELSPNMIRLWLREQGIRNVGAVDVLPLRGRLSGFNLLEPVTRAQWAAVLKPADVLIFDCLRPALDALALSEDKDAGRFLEALDELTAEAGIRELAVVHHMGHNNERSRGDSRILDWPDAVWKIVRSAPDDPASERFFSAYGRDVEQTEVRLAFNPVNRHLAVDGGSRRDTKAFHLNDDVLAYVADNPGCTQTAIEREITGDRMSVRSSIRSLAQSNQIRVDVQKQSRRHFLVELVLE